MEFLSQSVLVIGLVVAAGSMVWVYFCIFRYSVSWGFACLLVPVVGFWFMVNHYDVIARPLRWELAGLGLLLLGLLLDSLA